MAQDIKLRVVVDGIDTLWTIDQLLAYIDGEQTDASPTDSVDFGPVLDGVEPIDTTTPTVPVVTIPTPPIVTTNGLTLPDQIGQVGKPFRYEIPTQAFGLALSVDVSDLPPGLRYDAPVISGIPTKADTRTLTVTVKTNSGLQRATLRLTINP